MNKMVSHPLSTTNVLISVRSKLESGNYSAQTIKAYLGQLKIFFRHINPQEPYTVTAEEIRGYLDQLVEGNLSRSTIDQAVNALDFFSKSTLNQPLNLDGFRRPAKKKVQPVLLTLDEVKKIAISAENPKHRLMIELAYTAGLRVSEVVAVKVKHLDLANLKLFVPEQENEGEGRTTIFSGSIRDALARQVGNKDPEGLLFPSERGGALTTRAVAKFFKAALEVSGVDKPVTPHSLRHSFGAFMLKNGNPPKVVKTLLGLRRAMPVQGAV
ncbi:MAG: putative integrase/recombinase y4qK [Nitrospinaceae bacterium]|nr:MAG: putative integrase/recombinase y4qK [Nitrospinaceae bacterium]